jgi:proteasome lid subunit RPN8/RPN11
MSYNRRSLEDTRRLQQDLTELEKLQNLIPSVIRFITQSKDPTAPDSYDIEIGVTSFIEVARHGIPKSCEHFKMKIKLPIDYPYRALPDCRIYPAPFHPHVKKLLFPSTSSYGVWIEPRSNKHNEGLGTLVLRIAHSLQFDEKYIDVNPSRIGNPEALEWYRYWRDFFKQNLKSWFPTGKTVLPETIPFIQKKFDVEPKSFNVGTDAARRENRFAVASTSPTRKTFQIVESTLPYEPTPATVPNYSELQPSNFQGTHKTHCFYIKPKAIKKIFEHISWGNKHTRTNKVEQGGIMLGHSHRDEETGIIFGVVEDSIAGDSATGTSASLEMGHTTWKEMIDRVDSMLEETPSDDLQIIGWYHTHPNTLDVFMSGTDKGTQMRFFSNEWQFAIVLNPHKQIWRAFYGKHAEECEGFIIVEE